MSGNEDLHIIACNFAQATSECAEGALAYVLNDNPGWGNERLELLARSRSGRWIIKWEAIFRLGNFRQKTIPPEHPLRERVRLAVPASSLTLEGLQHREADEKARRKAASPEAS